METSRTRTEPGLRLWHIAALLAAGVAVGVLLPGRLADAFSRATLYVFLPALIFEGAWQLNARTLLRVWKPVALLAIPGVAVTTGAIAAIVHVAGPFGWRSALLLGAILSATDPVAVIAIFRRLRVPERLATIVEGEALFNDGIAVVLYRAILAAAVFGEGSWAAGRAAALAVAGVVLGCAFGVLLGFLASLILRRHAGAPVQSLVTFAFAYLGYAVAERTGVSGIFCIIALAIALRCFARDTLRAERVARIDALWARAALGANVVLFFLIGTVLDVTRLGPAVAAIGVTAAAVLIARAVIAYGLLAAGSQVRGVWRTVVRMAGLRGALSLALALATPAAIAQRGLVVDTTFGVVVVTLFLGSLTLERRIRRLQIEP